jgi:hypothetical protein
MPWTCISWHPSDRVLRQFSVTALAFLAVFACRLGFPSHVGMLQSTLGIVATVMAALGILWPQTIRWPYLCLTLLTLPVGWLVARVLLTALWLGAITPLGLCFRLLGRDALGLSPRGGASSYWESRKPITDARRYLQSF